ncbi:hypothetical protein ACHAXR_010359, partial [Thalassiosira sp. AJA248-18]
SSNLPKTFAGDRGGDAADADLLAELRAISNKSSTNRFDGEEDEAGATSTSNLDANAIADKPDNSVAEKPWKKKNAKQAKALPPWKQKGSKKKTAADMNDDVDIVVAAPPAASVGIKVDPFQNAMFDDDVEKKGSGVEESAGKNTDDRKSTTAAEPREENMGIKSSLRNTFKGDRGGSAEDADLLAELRAISMKSSNNRFDGNDDKIGASAANNEGDVSSTKKRVDDVAPSSMESTDDAKSKAEKERPLPPWRRKGAKKKKADASNDLDVVIAAPPRALESCAMETVGPDQAVEKSSGVEDKVVPLSDVDEKVVTTEGDSDVVAVTEGNMGIKSSLRNTFKGDRGGSAEDADLLAELRAISMKTSTNRFDGEGDKADAVTLNDDRNVTANKSDSTVAEKPWKKTKAASNNDASAKPLPPWKRKGAKKKAVSKDDAMDIVIAAPPAPSEAGAADVADSQEAPSIEHTSTEVADNAVAAQSQEENLGIKSNLPKGMMKSNLPNTFKGDRGGSAEDEDLLRELRAISMKSSTDRFGGEEDEAGAIPSHNKALGTSIASNDKTPHGDVPSFGRPSNSCQSKPQENQNSSSIKPDFPKASSQGPVSSVQGSNTMGVGGMSQTTPPPSADTEIVITLEGLEDSLKSTKWQMRKASYLFLHARLTSLLLDSEPMNQLHGGGVYPNLDSLIPQALKDKNAGALDAALTMAVLYADSCQGACSDNAASQIMASLLKGTAFSSSRSSTLSQTEDLVLKLIEVAPESSSSIDDIFDMIHDGLKSRKPKVVIFSAKLILKSVHTFGAGVLPIPKLSSHSESLIAHSNAQVREVGIQLLAEMCRTLGSKNPLQNLVDKLKKSQQSQLDSLLNAQPSVTRPSKCLRCKAGQPVSTQSPEEALAALKKNQEEDEAKMLAARPAVNLFQVLPQTCYKEKIKLDKWSEKVAALGALIEAGGEQPFKLCLPSSSVNYTPLIRELTQLLSHTHFAVCSKSLAALGMLAEGVGEELFSNLRPLIPTLLALFKDKKVANAVGSCLDKMFANVFSFEHLLDSLPSLLDEKKQKNALVRSKTLDYLTRCVKTSGTYGTRGDLTSQNAEDLSKLACGKLKDSDASTRKAATDVLLTLLNCEEESVVLATKNVTSALQSTNPRAYKSLQLASNGDKKTVIRPQSAPAKAPSKASKREPSSSNRTTKEANRTVKSAGAPKLPSAPNQESSNETLLPSFEDAVENLSALTIAKWGHDIDDGGILAGIQSSNWKARMGALNHLATFYKTTDERVFDTIPSLFVLVRDCTKSFKESNFNVAKALIELFTAIFDIHMQLVKAPESYLYIPATKIAVEKVGDRKLCGASSLCLHTICTVKDPQRVLAVAVKTVGDVKSPLVHEALLGWFKTFCIDFGASSLSNGMQDSLTWILKECESNNMKVRKSALDVMGVLNSQLGPVLQAFVKSKDIQNSAFEKVFSDNPHDTNDQSGERKMKCVTLSAPSNASQQGSSRSNASSILSIPTTDIVGSLKSDCLSRINITEGKSAWKQRKEGMEEVNACLSKCGGLIETEGKAFLSLKQLFIALRSRLNDSQSNLKPIAATLIGSLLNHVDDEPQAKLGKIVFPALANAAMNDMKKTMRDAAVSALSMGTERPKQNGGGTNLAATECFIVCLQSVLSDAALKSSGLPDVLTFLTARVKSIFSSESSKTLSGRELAKVVVQSLLSSKAGTRSSAEKLLKVCRLNNVVPSEALDKEIGKLVPAQQRTIRSFIPKLSPQEQELVDTFKRPSSRAQQHVRPSSSRQPVRRETTRSNVTAPVSTSDISASETRNESSFMVQKNPLHPSSSKSTKLQRLSLLGRSDHWPEYPEEPNDTTLHTLRKSWSLMLSPSSIQYLFPKGGIHSHEDAVKGCEIISQSIEFSRSDDDNSFLEQLDLIFKWAACSISARDHTSGLRSLLAMIQLLFGRLHELSYVLNDGEAKILLPCLLTAGVAKSQFKDQFVSILSFVRSNELYPLQKYGPNICILVLDKSKSNRARSLAATECSSCVIAIGVGAIGKKGMIALSRALTLEKVTEIRMSYLDLFYNVVQKYGDLDKLLSIIGDDNLTDKTKQMILDRCSKRPATAPAGSRAMHHANESKPSRLRTPSRRSVARTSSVSPRASNEASEQAVMGTMKARLQSRKEETEGSIPMRQAMPLSKADNVNLYMNAVSDIGGMINEAETTSANDAWIAKGSRAIHMLLLAMKNDASEGTVNAAQIETLRHGIASDMDGCVETLISVLAFAFDHGGKNAALPCHLIQETVDALIYFFRTAEYVSAISQKSLEYTLWETVHALLDDRLTVSNKTDGIGPVVRSIN